MDLRNEIQSSGNLQHRGHWLYYCRAVGIAMGQAPMTVLLGGLWTEDQGQDIAEYAVMLAVILVIVAGTIRLVGSNANNVFSATASSIQ